MDGRGFLPRVLMPKPLASSFNVSSAPLSVGSGRDACASNYNRDHIFTWVGQEHNFDQHVHLSSQ